MRSARDHDRLRRAGEAGGGRGRDLPGRGEANPDRGRARHDLAADPGLPDAGGRGGPGPLAARRVCKGGRPGLPLPKDPGESARGGADRDREPDQRRHTLHRLSRFRGAAQGPLCDERLLRRRAPAGPVLQLERVGRSAGRKDRLRRPAGGVSGRAAGDHGPADHRGAAGGGPPAGGQRPDAGGLLLWECVAGERRETDAARPAGRGLRLSPGGLPVCARQGGGGDGAGARHGRHGLHALRGWECGDRVRGGPGAILSNLERHAPRGAGEAPPGAAAARGQPGQVPGGRRGGVARKPGRHDCRAGGGVADLRGGGPARRLARLRRLRGRSARGAVRAEDRPARGHGRRVLPGHGRAADGGRAGLRKGLRL